MLGGRYALACRVMKHTYDRLNLACLVRSLLLVMTRQAKAYRTMKLRSNSRTVTLANVAVGRMSIKAGTTEGPRQFISHHNRTMPPTSATDSNRHVRLSFSFVERQQVSEQVGKTLQRLTHLVCCAQILHYAAVMARQSLEFRNKV